MHIPSAGYPAGISKLLMTQSVSQWVCWPVVGWSAGPSVAPFPNTCIGALVNFVDYSSHLTGYRYFLIRIKYIFPLTPIIFILKVGSYTFMLLSEHLFLIIKDKIERAETAGHSIVVFIFFKYILHTYTDTILHTYTDTIQYIQ